MPVVKLHTLGCKVNQYDTQSIRERFLERGFQEASSGEKTDICVINTCTVTSSADQKSRSAIRRYISENPKAKILVTGCMVKNDSKSLAKIKGIDFIVSKEFFAEGVSSFSAHTRAFLKIQDGCNNFCSYCKVPLVRGRSKSKPINSIIREARSLSCNGFREVVLTGICVGAYGKDLNTGVTLVDLIKEVGKIEGIERIRLSSIEPGDVEIGLIELMSKSEKFCHHLHIPLQSGDDSILKKMNRRYTGSDYINLVKTLKKIIPDIAITTDCLVGFPGETELNFKNTLNLIESIHPLRTHIFPYSEREGTFAKLNFKDSLNPDVIKDRLFRLKVISNKAAILFQKSFIGKKTSVLFECKVKDKTGYWEGYTGNYIRIIYKTPNNVKNKVLNLTIKGFSSGFLVAKYT